MTSHVGVICVGGPQNRSNIRWLASSALERIWRWRLPQPSRGLISAPPANWAPPPAMKPRHDGTNGGCSGGPVPDPLRRKKRLLPNPTNMSERGCWRAPLYTQAVHVPPPVAGQPGCRRGPEAPVWCYQSDIPRGAVLTSIVSDPETRLRGFCLWATAPT